MFEKLAELFAPTVVPLSPQAEVERVAAAVAEIEQRLADAKAKAAALQKDYSAGLLKSLADGNAAKRTATRKALEEADREAEDLVTALANARVGLAKAKERAAASDLETRWANEEDLLGQLVEAAAALQADAKSFVRKYERYLYLSKQCLDACPVPVRRDILSLFAEAHLAGSVLAFLCAASSARLVKTSGMSLAQVQALPDILEQAQKTAKAVLWLKERTEQGDSAA